MKAVSLEPKFPLLALSRLRMETDGEGVTTLIAGAGCPLKCKWCINRELLEKGKVQSVSPVELYEKVKRDDLYFRATGGGVTFGGGESLLHSAFIVAFRRVCGADWKICVETSLHVPLTQLQEAFPAIDEFIVDVKDPDPAVYRGYCGGDSALMMENLRWILAHRAGKQIKLRIPCIPEFNTPEDCRRTEELLRSMGAENTECFTYIIK